MLGSRATLERRDMIEIRAKDGGFLAPHEIHANRLKSARQIATRRGGTSSWMARTSRLEPLDDGPDLGPSPCTERTDTAVMRFGGIGSRPRKRRGRSGVIFGRAWWPR